MSVECCCAGDGRPAESRVSWRVRPMRYEDIEKCLLIWFQVELTEARQTVASSLESDPDGFYVAELESTGKFRSSRNL